MDRPVWGAFFAFVLGIATLGGVGMGFEGRAVGRAVDRAVESGEYCHGSDRANCVARVPAVLGQPHDQYRQSADWWPVEPDQGPALGGFKAGSSHDQTLQQYAGQPVTALTYRGDLVAVRLDSGVVVVKQDIGPNGAAMNFALAAASGSGVVALLGFAFGARAQRRSWWMRGPAKKRLRGPAPQGPVRARRIGLGGLAITGPGALVGTANVPPSAVIVTMVVAALVLGGVLGYRWRKAKQQDPAPAAP